MISRSFIEPRLVLSKHLVHGDLLAPARYRWEIRAGDGRLAEGTGLFLLDEIQELADWLTKGLALDNEEVLWLESKHSVFKEDPDFFFADFKTPGERDLPSETHVRIVVEDHEHAGYTGPPLFRWQMSTDSDKLGCSIGEFTRKEMEEFTSWLANLNVDIEQRGSVEINLS